MASLAQRAWVWVNSRSWWWTGRPGVLQSMGSQSRTRLSSWTELNWGGRSPYGIANPSYQREWAPSLLAVASKTTQPAQNRKQMRGGGAAECHSISKGRSMQGCLLHLNGPVLRSDGPLHSVLALILYSGPGATAVPALPRGSKLIWRLCGPARVPSPGDPGVYQPLNLAGSDPFLESDQTFPSVLI